MARTRVHDYTKRKVAAIFTDMGPGMEAWAKEQIAGMQKALEENYGDYDKAGDMEDHAYYAGAIDILVEVLENFTIAEHAWDSAASYSGHGVCKCGWSTGHYAMSNDSDLDAEFDAHLAEKTQAEVCGYQNDHNKNYACVLPKGHEAGSRPGDAGHDLKLIKKEKA